MKRLWWILGLVLLLGACEDDFIFVDDPVGPAPPLFVEASYANFAVVITWEMSSDWDGEFFRVWGRRVGDAEYLIVADVSSCSGGFCEYTDTNIQENTSYEYFVSAVDPGTLAEADSDELVVVDVPSFAAPPIPQGLEVVALDGANYMRWSDNARGAADFLYYRVYLLSEGDALLLGETDSEGFLDLLAENGVTSRYAVTSVDEFEHETDLSQSAVGTPRPDFTAEAVYDFFDDAENSGFRFQEDESLLPIVSGFDQARHFRLEVDGQGWWLVPGPGTQIFPTGAFTTELKCGVAADADCVDWTEAPSAGYTTADVGIEPEYTYMFRVVGDDELTHYGSIRVSLVGSDQDGFDLMVFDWSYQIQANNPVLVTGPGG